MTQLRSVTCHMGSHSVTFYPTQVNTPRLNLSHAGRYSIYLPRRDGRMSWPSWLDSVPAGSRTSDLSITSPTPNHCTAKTTSGIAMLHDRLLLSNSRASCYGIAVCVRQNNSVISSAQSNAARARNPTSRVTPVGLRARAALDCVCAPVAGGTFGESKPG